MLEITQIKEVMLYKLQRGDIIVHRSNTHPLVITRKVEKQDYFFYTIEVTSLIDGSTFQLPESTSVTHIEKTKRLRLLSLPFLIE